MKVLVISDTHRNIQNVIHVIERIRPLGVSTIIHCGDHIGDAHKLKKLYPDIEIYAVYGNCDGMAYPEEYTRVVVIEQVSILITHGHRYGIKWDDYSELLIDAEAEGAKLAICGHSHSAYLKKEKGIILLNPGSITLPRDSNYPSYAIVDLEDGRVKDISIMQIIENSRVCTHPAYTLYKNK
ncbi:metallophosphoesterase family protein [Cellulosilyticum sp. I15G10I2]|uniref:metallophosphoesterase family protein n=1 Tax=Cellulosilyticum sp. I15G10I2 TaxID=1892843 RepID=UPI00085C198B|nr:metallophosphoesterase [Cellulosilyticum sp. I15G10I2]